MPFIDITVSTYKEHCDRDKYEDEEEK